MLITLQLRTTHTTRQRTCLASHLPPSPTHHSGLHLRPTSRTTPSPSHHGRRTTPCSTRLSETGTAPPTMPQSVPPPYATRRHTLSKRSHGELQHKTLASAHSSVPRPAPPVFTSLRQSTLSRILSPRLSPIQWKKTRTASLSRRQLRPSSKKSVPRSPAATLSTNKHQTRMASTTALKRVRPDAPTSPPL